MRFHFSVDPSLPHVPETIEWGKVVMRGRVRGDYQNPPQGTRAGNILSATWALVWLKVKGRLRGLELQSSSLAYVDPGEEPQPFHCDADGDKKYHTIIVPLTTERESGGTEFEDGLAYLPVRGIGYCFDGAVVHRGGAHRGVRRRVFAAFTLAPGVYDDLNVFTRN